MDLPVRGSIAFGGERQFSFGSRRGKLISLESKAAFFVMAVTRSRIEFQDAIYFAGALLVTPEREQQAAVGGVCFGARLVLSIFERNCLVVEIGSHVRVSQAFFGHCPVEQCLRVSRVQAGGGAQR